MMAKKNVSHLTLADYSRMNSDEYRASFNPFGNKPTPESTGDCNSCCHNKNMAYPGKGKRVPGSFGKCVRPGGPCANPVPRGTRDLITGAPISSKYKATNAVAERELCDEEGCEDRAECMAVPPSPDAVCIRNEKKATAGKARTAAKRAARKEKGKCFTAS